LNSEEEKILVQQAQAGDTGAFSDLVKAHQQFAFNVALRAVNNNQDAEDIVQEAFVRAWKSLSRFRQEARFKTWIYRIVMNLCYNHLPKLKHAPLLLDEEITVRIKSGNGQEADPASSLETKEMLENIQRHIRDLPNQYQIMLMLRFQDNCSYGEISEIMDLPLGTIKTGIHRARKRLKAAVRQNTEKKVRS
jgi:RNA polymerase sigma-70 factor (ECF subfamily)